ncbi:GntR family transcriptional regulator [Castellaniella sp.]|uniref:GntR family transcriptional regulator n=1 Tax=Castellaniella sp. TaxID=1955812 RepID=UPI003C726235
MPTLNGQDTEMQEAGGLRAGEEQRLAGVERIIESDPLNPSSPVPLYAQLATRLSAYITSLGEQGVGRLFPSENECIRMFGVSRPTVRQAITELMAQGLVRKERGRGTFICEPRMVHDIAHIFEDDMRAVHRTVEFNLLEHGEVPVPPALLPIFGSGTERLYRFLRLRSVAGRVMGLEERFLLTQFKHSLTPKVLMESHVFSILKLCTQADAITSMNAVRAAALNAHDASLTGVQEGSTALIRETTYFIDKKAPVMYGVVTFLADLYQLRFQSTIELRTKQTEEGHRE